MLKQGHKLLHAAIVAVAAVSFWLPMVAHAGPGQQAERVHSAKPHPRKHVAGTYRRRPAAIAPSGLFGSAPNRETSRCSWPYQSQFPPCMSTWPAGDPNYHGSWPGPTFDH